MQVTLFDQLLREYHAAKAKHDWTGYDGDAMANALVGELMEMGEAESRGDVHGPHGMVREAIQVAVVALRIAEHLTALHPVMEVE
jgi:hypothetical protein